MVASRAVAELWDDGVVDIFAGCVFKFSRGLGFARRSLSRAKGFVGEIFSARGMLRTGVRCECSADQKLKSSNLLAVVETEKR